MMDFNEMEQRVELLNALTPMTVQMSEMEFIPFLCMLAEEYCLARHLDVCGMVDQMQELVHDINEQLGRYGHETLAN